MSGFKMPIVCKDIYLPIPSETLTFAQYKEKYGVDLKSFLYGVAVEAQNNKIFLVDSENHIYNNATGLRVRNGVYLAIGSFTDESEEDVIYLGFNLFDKDSGVTTTYFDGISIDTSNNVIAPAVDLM